jgi:hypothetical protein
LLEVIHRGGTVPGSSRSGKSREAAA